MKVFKKSVQLIILFVCLLISFNVKADITLPKIFGNDMVMQRGQPLIVWGWASPGEEVTVTINGRTVVVKTDKKGKWKGQLSPLPAGGPYEMIFKGKNKIILSDILIGDVWICGGQSNMQWRVDQTGYQETDSTLMATAIRLFTVHTDMDYLPKEDIKGSGWKGLTRQNINEFSAVAYHFGKYLQRELDVPIGLISVNLGATAIETWMSNEALSQFPQFSAIIDPVIKQKKSFDDLNRDFEKMKPKWYEKHYYKGHGVDEEWFKPETNITGWKNIKASGNTWEGEPDLKDHDGAVWFRTTFDLPDQYDQENFNIHLLQIDDYDIAWVNGVKAGESYGKHNHRSFSISTGLLKPRDNVLVIRVFDTGGTGGFTTSSFWGNHVLWGEWLYRKDIKIDATKFPKPNVPNATPFSSPGVLYNGMVAPLTTLRIKGAIWYQGESNADRAYEYRALFPAMIRDWRERWGQGNFPFLFVQLANHHEESPEPVESSWAELREAQAMALALPQTGMATAIDIGEANDIHPKNKQEVGRRLGVAAMKTAYDRSAVFSGPSFKSMRAEKNTLIIEYDNVGSGLITKDKYGYIRGFQVAGSDQKFHWAEAYLDGDHVVVTAKAVPNPVAVRYAWDDNPGPLDLYNQEGLPAVPFRSDSWDGITAGKVFTEGPRF